MEEIKASDIMLNNWLSYTNENGTFNLQVEEIRPTGIITTWNGGAWFVSYDKLKGIPLTEDVLLKCGFEKVGFGFYLYKDFIVRKMLFTDNDWRFIFRHRDIKDIKHIHQLQNLFKSLTGNDLKIEV